MKVLVLSFALVAVGSFAHANTSSAECSVNLIEGKQQVAIPKLTIDFSRDREDAGRLVTSLAETANYQVIAVSSSESQSIVIALVDKRQKNLPISGIAAASRADFGSRSVGLVYSSMGYTPVNVYAQADCRLGN